MYAFALKYLLGLNFVGIIWTVSGETSLNSSASGDNKTAGMRQRREETEIMTNEERKEFLDTHNKVRRDITKTLNHPQPTASNMMRMYWNAHLEASAVAWSKKMCTLKDLKHGQSDGIVKQPAFISALSNYDLANIGQNIFVGGGKNASNIIMLYASETKNYQHGSEGVPCKPGTMCGHYTQVVWHDSFLLGCGYARCAGKYYSACNYLLAGNWPTPPFTAGTPCSNCASDKSCKRYGFTECETQQLCVPKDRCSPVKECKVVDTENCLCSESDYEEAVAKTIKDVGAIHTGPPVVVFGLLLPLVAILLGQGA